MNNNLHIYLIAFVVTLAIAGGYFYPRSTEPKTISSGSPVGSTFSTAKVAQINITPNTGIATSSSILNTDSSDRWVTSLYGACTGVGTSLTAYTGTGLAGWTLKAATTSTDAGVTAQAVTNSNLIATLELSTSTPYLNTFSPAGTTTPVKTLWASGSYMTFFFNATNTAACTAGVSYISS